MHWRVKRAYAGLHSVYAAFLEHSGLKRPSFYQLTDTDDRSRSVEMIAELRNLIVHGASTRRRRSTCGHSFCGPVGSWFVFSSRF
jgi:hypothetical protein